MATVNVKCKYCKSTDIEKNGKSKDGRQYYRCKECRKKFMLDYKYNGCNPGIDEDVVKLSINGCGISDITRILGIGKNRVKKALKKKPKK